MFSKQQLHLVLLVASVTLFLVSVLLWWWVSTLFIGVCTACLVYSSCFLLWMWGLGMRTHYTRWTYIALVVLLVVLWAIKWYTHQWILLCMFCLWIITFFDAKVWVIVW